MAADRFPSPFDIATPDGAEGWESMYDWYHLFGPERRELDEQRFWFADRLHHPDVLHPYDEIQCECWWQALGAFNTRDLRDAAGVRRRPAHRQRPPLRHPGAGAAGGHRGARRGVRQARAGTTTSAGTRSTTSGRTRSSRSSRRSARCASTRCPTSSPSRPSTSTSGTPPGFRMIRDFDQLVLTMYETYQYHFELLNIGYAAYLTFFGMCKAAFPDISDQSISRMVGGLRRRALPARRRAQAARQGGAAARARPTRISATSDAATLFAGAARRPRRAPSGWPTGSARPTRGSSSTPTPATPAATTSTRTWADDPDIPLAVGARVPAPARRRARRSTGRPTRCCASATGSPASTAS